MNYKAIARRYDKLFSRKDIGTIIVDALEEEGVEFSEKKEPYFVNNDSVLRLVDNYRTNSPLECYEQSADTCLIIQVA